MDSIFGGPSGEQVVVAVAIRLLSGARRTPAWRPPITHDKARQVCLRLCGAKIGQVPNFSGLGTNRGERAALHAPALRAFCWYVNANNPFREERRITALWAKPRHVPPWNPPRRFYMLPGIARQRFSLIPHRRGVNTGESTSLARRMTRWEIRLTFGSIDWSWKVDFSISG
jgi:hypothetical protein